MAVTSSLLFGSCFRSSYPDCRPFTRVDLSEAPWKQVQRSGALLLSSSAVCDGGGTCRRKCDSVYRQGHM